MARIRRIHASDARSARILTLTVSREDSVSSTPAESNGTNLVRARDHPHSVDEAVDKRLADALAVLEQPWRKRGADDGGVLSRVDHAGGFFVLERRLDVLEERDGERVALVDVGNVDVVAGFGVVVREEAGVFEFPTED